jgi:hypothetical protein
MHENLYIIENSDSKEGCISSFTSETEGDQDEVNMYYISDYQYFSRIGQSICIKEFQIITQDKITIWQPPEIS